jgi:hypothetical protein
MGKIEVPRMTDYKTLFTMEELKIIGNLCETMKHWRRHNPEIRFPDSLYEQLENIQTNVQGLERYMAKALFLT